MRAAQLEADLRTKYPNATLRDDGACYAFEAPAGHTWDGDLHEFIACYGTAKPIFEEGRTIRITRSQALQDLADRCERPQACMNAECEWCNPEDGNSI